MKSEDENDASHKRCEKALEHALTTNRGIQKVVEGIESLGCKIPESFFACRRCDGEVSGGLSVSGKADKGYKPQVIMCENSWLEQETFENTIIHELIHAYDVCRVKALDFSNCQKLACTEVRASALSGECSYIHEIARGNIALMNGHRDCVQRRAELSVSMHPGCKDSAKKSIESIFERCYYDTSPFETPR